MIKNKEDWAKLAEQVLKQLPSYMRNFKSVDWNQEKAEKFFQEKQFGRLANMFETLWFELPDSQIIRFGPFFDLCDLCSERGVLNK